MCTEKENAPGGHLLRAVSNRHTWRTDTPPQESVPYLFLAGTILEKLLARLNRGMVENYWPVTFSVGAITYDRALPNSVQEMITAADRLMYQAKEGGKNRVVVAEYAETIDRSDSLPLV
jgi:GGDEF domain-containing protein